MTDQFSRRLDVKKEATCKIFKLLLFDEGLVILLSFGLHMIIVITILSNTIMKYDYSHVSRFVLS